MNPVLVATAIAVVAGAVVALSARNARIVLPALGACLVLAPLVADPLPDAPPFIARAAAAMLAIEICWIGLRDRSAPLPGSLVGWPATALVGIAAAVAGSAVTTGSGGGQLLAEIGSVSTPPLAAARAVGFALMALSIGSVLVGRDPWRVGLGSFLLIAGAELVRNGVVGPAGALEQVAVAGMTVALAAMVAAAGAVSQETAGATPAATVDRGIGRRQPVVGARPPMDRATDRVIDRAVSRPAASEREAGRQGLRPETPGEAGRPGGSARLAPDTPIGRAGLSADRASAVGGRSPATPAVIRRPGRVEPRDVPAPDAPRSV